jgi:hypothetical protein
LGAGDHGSGNTGGDNVCRAHWQARETSRAYHVVGLKGSPGGRPRSGVEPRTTKEALASIAVDDMLPRANHSVLQLAVRYLAREDMREFLKYCAQAHPFELAAIVALAALFFVGAGYVAYVYVTLPDKIPAECVNRSELVAQFWQDGNYRRQLHIYSSTEQPWLGGICFFEDPETLFTAERDEVWAENHLTGELVEYLRHHPDMIDSPLITNHARNAFRQQKIRSP